MSRIAFHGYHAQVFQVRTKGCQGFDHDQLDIVCQEFVNDMLADSAVPTDDEMSSQLIYPFCMRFLQNRLRNSPATMRSANVLNAYAVVLTPKIINAPVNTRPTGESGRISPNPTVLIVMTVM